MGDWNARIGKEGKLNDRFIGHLGYLIPDIEENPTYDRSSCDNKINQSGRERLNLCNKHSLNIIIIIPQSYYYYYLLISLWSKIQFLPQF